MAQNCIQAGLRPLYNHVQVLHDFLRFFKVLLLLKRVPICSNVGPKTSEQGNIQGLSQNKVLSTPAARVSSKSGPSPVVNPMIPLSSPLWNMPTLSCDALAC